MAAQCPGGTGAGPSMTKFPSEASPFLLRQLLRVSALLVHSMDETRTLIATPIMLRAHRANVRIDPLGPTPERAAKAEIRPPAIDQQVHRDAPEVLDIFKKYGDLQAWDGLKEYVTARNSEAAAGIVANGYEPRVDGGGWRSYGGIEGLPKEFHEQSANLAQIHERLGRQARAALDALADAARDPQNPCPFEKFVGNCFFSRFGSETTKREGMIYALNWAAEQIKSQLQKQHGK